MRLNSVESIREALDAHDRFGSWAAVREASRRIARELDEGKAGPRLNDQRLRHPS